MLGHGKQSKRRIVKPVKVKPDVIERIKLSVRLVVKYFIAKHVSISISKIRSALNTRMYARCVTNVLRLKLESERIIGVGSINVQIVKIGSLENINVT